MNHEKPEVLKKLYETINKARDEVAASRDCLSRSLFSEFDRNLIEAEQTKCNDLLTEFIVYTYDLLAKIRRHTVTAEDDLYGPSVPFYSRGIGTDSCPGCFVSGGNQRLMSNIAGIVNTEDDAKLVVGWFGGIARYERKSTNCFQVKVGACDDHLKKLQHLDKLVGECNVIRQAHITEAKAYE